MSDTVVIGTGIHPFGRFANKSYIEMGLTASQEALADAGISWSDVDATIVSSMYLPATSGPRILKSLGSTDGIPIFDVEAACASGGVALRQAMMGIQAGEYDLVLVLGVEKMPRGFMDPRMIYEDWQIATGMCVNPAYWALRARRHMFEHGTTEEQIGLVAVKNHQNSVNNPNAMYRKAFTLDEIFESPLVCDPIHLLEVCAPNDGAAAVLVASADRAKSLRKDAIKLLACTHAVTSSASDFRSPADSMSVIPPPPLTIAAKQAYERSGIGPSEIDCFEVQDTDAFCEIEAYEELGLCSVGEGGSLIADGATQIGGRSPVNMSGGLISKGEPVGASHLGQIVEIVTQLRGRAGGRQVSAARVGLAHVLGAGGNCAVTILMR